MSEATWTSAEAHAHAGCYSPHFTLNHPGPQQLQITFDGPRIVSDVGLLAVPDLDRRLGVLAGLAELFPDTRSLKYCTHSAEALLTQQVY